MKRNISIAAISLLLLAASLPAVAQRPEITISVNEAFMDSVLDAVFSGGKTLDFPLAANLLPSDKIVAKASGPTESIAAEPCGTISLRRESNGVKTAVRFRDGKIIAPIAFIGSYNPPLIGCVQFAGYAETTIDLVFDANSRKLVGRARVNNVVLNGTGGIGGTLVAGLVQNSIDSKVNPIDIVSLEKLSFLLPIRNANLNLRAVGIRAEIAGDQLLIHVAYDVSG